jgi:hypothetical protein
MTQKRCDGGSIQAGEIPIMKTLAKKLAPPTQAQLKLVEAAAAIREQPDAAEIAYMARQLVLCTLPHSDRREAQRPDLGAKFFQAVRALPVPVDTRALKALKRSPLASSN